MDRSSLFRTFAFVIFIFESANAASFAGDIGTHTKSVGDNIQLDCTVNDYDDEVNIVWYRIGSYESEMVALGDMKVIPDKNIHVEIRRDEATNTATSSIRIYELKFSDFAVYQCAIQGTGIPDQKVQGEILMAESEVPNPEIRMEKEPSSPRVGQKVKLSCYVSSYAGNSMMWFKMPEKSHLSADMISAGPMVLLGQSKYGANLDQTGDSAIYTLVIKSLTAKDSGIYKCQAQVIGQAWDKNPYGLVQLSVAGTDPIIPTNPPVTTTPKPTEAPKPPATITNTIGVVSAEQGKDVSLDCLVSNRYGREVTWSKMLAGYAFVISKGSAIVNENDRQYSVSVFGDTYRLIIKSAFAEDAGKYRCSVIGNSDGSIPMIEGYLIIRPKVSSNGISIQNALGNQDARVGTEARFQCEVKNLRSSQIFWLFAPDNIHTPNAIAMGTLILTPNRKYSTKITRDGDVTISSLYIADVSAREEGIYRCMVKVSGMNYDDFPRSDGFLSVV